MLDSIKSQKRGHFIFMHWIDEKEMLDITALAQSSPGAIAVNVAILVGWQVDGLLGMLLAVLGTIIPPMVTLSVISLFYAAFASNVYVAFALKGMQAGVAAVILDVVCGLGRNVLETHSPIYIGLMLLAFIASFVYDYYLTERAIDYDLLATFFKLCASWYVQHRRWLCRHAIDTKSSC